MIPPLGLQRGGRPRPRRLAALAAAPLLGVSLIAATPSTATTTDETDQAVSLAVADAGFTALADDVAPVAVTLITGDTVYWADSGDGNAYVEDIRLAPRDVPVTFDQAGTSEDFYVIPSDVMEHVVDGTLDMELFNIPSLIEQGLDDESTGGELPVIVTFDDKRDVAQLERAADALPAASEPRGVAGIRGAGVKVDRGKANRFRDAVLAKPSKDRGVSTQSNSLPGGVDRILLDRMLEVDLDESGPQIGAPEAWDAGYTGEGVTVAVGVSNGLCKKGLRRWE